MFDPVRRKLLIASSCAAALALPGMAFAEGGSIADIKKRGKLVIGTEAAYEPYEFVKDGKIVGYSRDVLQYVVDKLGVQLEQLNLPFQGLLPGLLAHKFDFVATSVGINPERAKRFAFTRPVGVSEAQLMVRVDDGSIKGPNDLAGKLVGTQMGSSNQPVAAGFNDELKGKSGKGYAELKLFQSYPDTAVALANKQLDVAIIASNVASALMQAQPGSFKIVGRIGDVKYLSWVTNPQDLELRAFINQCIAEIAANGKLDALQKKWFSTTLQLPADNYLPAGAI